LITVHFPVIEHGFFSDAVPKETRAWRRIHYVTYKQVEEQWSIRPGYFSGGVAA